MVKSAPLWVLAGALVAGCMLGPPDGQVIGRTTDPVPFSGAVLGPGEAVTVRAFDFQTRLWNVVGTTASSARPVARLATTDLYTWSAALPLAPRFWLAGFPTGFGARVYADTLSAQYGRAQLLSVRADWSSCVTSHPDPLQFASHCASARSPVAWIGTADFVPPVVRALDVRRHTTASITEPEVDRILSDATVLLQELDTNDVRCGEELQRRGRLSVFTTGDGSVDSDLEFAAVHDVGGDAMVVRDINWCGGIVPNVVGCASGDAFLVVRMSDLEEILWAHEHGHTRGLAHRTSEYAVMNPSVRATARGVNGSECAAYTGGAS